MANPLVLNEDEALELLAFLLTSARIAMDEPANYGPLRLLTAADRLSGFVKERASPESQKLLDLATAEIPDMHMRMSDVESYVESLDKLCRAVAGQLVERHGMEAKSS